MYREGAPQLNFNFEEENRRLFRLAGLEDPFQVALKDAPAVESILNMEDAPDVETFFGCPTCILFPTYGEQHQIDMQVDALRVLNDYILYEFPNRPTLHLLFVEGGRDSRAGDLYESSLYAHRLPGVNIWRERIIKDTLPKSYKSATDTGGELQYLEQARKMLYGDRPNDPTAHALVLGMAPHMEGISRLIKGKKMSGVTPISVEGILFALYPKLLEYYMSLPEYRSTEMAFRRGEVPKNILRQFDRDGSFLSWISSSLYKTALHRMVHGI